MAEAQSNETKSRAYSVAQPGRNDRARSPNNLGRVRCLVSGHWIICSRVTQRRRDNIRWLYCRRDLSRMGALPGRTH